MLPDADSTESNVLSVLHVVRIFYVLLDADCTDTVLYCLYCTLLTSFYVLLSHICPTDGSAVVSLLRDDDSLSVNDLVANISLDPESRNIVPKRDPGLEGSMLSVFLYA